MARVTITYSSLMNRSFTWYKSGVVDKSFEYLSALPQSLTPVVPLISKDIKRSIKATHQFTESLALAVSRAFIPHSMDKMKLVCRGHLPTLPCDRTRFSSCGYVHFEGS
ncbi:hypothetical protein AB6A40_009900 [Gnathostoma spinigerum]|uniref:Uncharacterized protein n=1 Tax=Gnathostoma spinigerum TaxID=75299 RepID=A0ABD6EV20_9BILA